MSLRRFLLILLSVLSLHLQPLCEAGAGEILSEGRRSYRTARNSQDDPQAPRSNTTGFIFKYTLITANSPDCDSSLVDNFPVRVQYRTIGAGSGGEKSNTSVSQWMDSPNMTGKHACTKY